MATLSGEHLIMQNVQAHFKEKLDGLYARFRLTRTAKDRKRVIRDMQKFNMDVRKHRGVIPPITATSLRQVALQKPDKPFLSFGRIMEASP